MLDPRLELLRLAGVTCGNDCACAMEYAQSMTFQQVIMMGTIVAKKSPAHQTAVVEIVKDAMVKMPLSPEEQILEDIFAGTPGPELGLAMLFEILGRNMPRGGPRRPSGDSSGERHHHHRERAPA